MLHFSFGDQFVIMARLAVVKALQVGNMELGHGHRIYEQGSSLKRRLCPDRAFPKRRELETVTLATVLSFHLAFGFGNIIYIGSNSPCQALSDL